MLYRTNRLGELRDQGRFVHEVRAAFRGVEVTLGVTIYLQSLILRRFHPTLFFVRHAMAMHLLVRSSMIPDGSRHERHLPGLEFRPAPGPQCGWH